MAEKKEKKEGKKSSRETSEAMDGTLNASTIGKC
jgi:hypothetical protein